MLLHTGLAVTVDLRHPFSWAPSPKCITAFSTTTTPTFNSLPFCSFGSLGGCRWYEIKGSLDFVALSAPSAFLLTCDIALTYNSKQREGSYGILSLTTLRHFIISFEVIVYGLFSLFTLRRFPCCLRSSTDLLRRPERSPRSTQIPPFTSIVPGGSHHLRI